MRHNPMANSKVGNRCRCKQYFSLVSFSLIFVGYASVSIILFSMGLTSTGFHTTLHRSIIPFPFESATFGLAAKKETGILTNASEIHNLLCQPNDNDTTPSQSEWAHLCSKNFVRRTAQILLDGDHVNVIQIGAHTGFEENDPIAKGLLRLLDATSAATGSNETRMRFHWTFVEPSPPNYKRLTKNLLKSSDICDMKGINVAVTPDGGKKAVSGNLKFYSIRDTIDPETGVDSISGITFPFWITQVSSLKLASIPKILFKKKGLKHEDYIIESIVTSKPYSDLIQQAMRGDQNQIPNLVLIDTEGFDCFIVSTMDNIYLPAYLLYEHKHCGPNILKRTKEELDTLGYDVYQMYENTIATKREAV